MSNYLYSQGTVTYKEAIKATESIESPALGFVKPSDYKGGISAPTAQIKQNNTQLQILVGISESLRDIKDDLKVIRESLRQIQSKEGSSSSAALPEELVEKLNNLSLGESKPSREKRGQLRVFKDPLRILEEEKAKLK
ncbi:hypothetical protein [Grapevine badnavirus 1]|uniref:P2 n=1 Tax=Grapevine badnavirus 1 TaxID=2052838 RepID=A0A2H4N959_9VIRU|nr:hypothetical protein KM646_gp1 [Grapevine badnavirus 1]ATV81253.1 hypothetical protein [Grapevine badnavirus 1]